MGFRGSGLGTRVWGLEFRVGLIMISRHLVYTVIWFRGLRLASFSGRFEGLSVFRHLHALGFVVWVVRCLVSWFVTHG